MKLMNFLKWSSLLYIGLCYINPIQAREADTRQQYASNNSFYVSPIAMSNLSIRGVSLAYERSLDARKRLSFYFPVGFYFKGNNFSEGDMSHISYVSYVGNRDVRRNGFNINPGLRFYPGARMNRVHYSIGVSIPVHIFHEEVSYLYNEVIDPDNINTRYELKQGTTSGNGFMIGFLLSNTMHIHVNDFVFFNTELGIGMPYHYKDLSKERVFKSRSVNYDGIYRYSPLVDFKVSIGIRFK